MPPLGPESKSELAQAASIRAKTETAVAKGVKCMRCWKEKPFCLCAAVPRLFDSGGRRAAWRAGGLRVHIFAYMSREDWLCGGNSGRLLHLLFPAETSFFVHGARAESERLRAAVAACGAQCRTCVLFPGTGALAIPEWLGGEVSAGAGACEEGAEEEAAIDSGEPRSGGDFATGSDDRSAESVSSVANESAADESVAVILVDGTWDQARRMAKYLKQTLLPSLPQVALTLSGSQRVSVFRRKQSMEGRICTAEALALFLAEVMDVQATRQGGTSRESGTMDTSMAAAGAAAAVTEVISETILLNNEALQPKGKEVFWHGDGGSPCWYFGERLANGRCRDEVTRGCGE
jgi:DTW domain-containing protein YfiP